MDAHQQGNEVTTFQSDKIITGIRGRGLKRMLGQHRREVLDAHLMNRERVKCFSDDYRAIEHARMRIWVQLYREWTIMQVGERYFELVGG